MSEPRIIKKYANRRLYDTRASTHVTLEEIRKMIVNGENVQVVDDKTGEDITRIILLQIISEQEQGGRPILSPQMLTHIIRFYGNPMQDFMASYLERSLDAFMSQQEKVKTQMTKMLAGTPFAAMTEAMTEMAEKNIEMWNTLQENMFKALDPNKTQAAGKKGSKKDA